MATTRVITSGVITDDELLHLPRDGRKHEVVDGELLSMSPAGFLHERIVARLAARLATFVEAQGLGDVVGSNAMYVLPSGNKRSPDLSFLAAGRLPTSEEPFPKIAPDLAVEVLSPGDTPREILDKVGEYLQSGVRLVWVIDPKDACATVYRSLTNVRRIAADGALDGEDLLPGFRCLLSELLPSGPSRPAA